MRKLKKFLIAYAIIALLFIIMQNVAGDDMAGQAAVRMLFIGIVVVTNIRLIRSKK